MNILLLGMCYVERRRFVLSPWRPQSLPKRTLSSPQLKWSRVHAMVNKAQVVDFRLIIDG
ncbi:XRE family transcriptional regulator [Methylocaldum marinum]|uniref:XRE family transcriptional regulator n=1 Tax=Methylocaldum marinum TaxID=1432792 RepID=A0A250L175_9GAMM|nr:XRE family transcriptional regulator [Methylocaldum marinum]